MDLDDFLNIAATGPIIGLDSESNAEPARDGRGFCTGVSLAIPFVLPRRLFHYLPFRHANGVNLEQRYLDKLKDILYFRAEHDLPFASHNAIGAELPFLKSLGIDLSDAFHYDTMLMSHLIDEVRPFKKSLEECVKLYCPGLDGKKDDETFRKMVKALGWGGVPSEFMYDYASWDANLHLELCEALLKHKTWTSENLDTYWRERKVKTIPVATAMMNRGIQINQDLCNRMADVGHLVMDSNAELLGLNPGSTKDLKTLLIDTLGLPVVKETPNGNPSFDKKAMEIYDQVLERQNSPVAQLVLEYRGWQKAVSSNYEPYVRLVSPDGRLRCNYKLHGTRSLRWSCELPNLQQIPRVSDKPWNGQMKQCFVGREGYTLIEGDYSQLEFRINAAYAHDENLIAIFNDDERDAFTEISQTIGFPRYDTKQMIYATGYGAGPARIALLLGISNQAAYNMIQNYSNSYPGIRAVSKRAMTVAQQKKKVQIWSGRYRHFDHFTEKTHKAFNAVVQGGAADIVEESMQRLYRELDSEDCRMLLQVHDSVVFEVRNELVDKYKPEIKRVMEAIPQDWGVKFRVDVHQWGM